MSLLLVTNAITGQLGISTGTLEYIRAKYGQAAENRIGYWQTLIKENTNKPDIEQLNVVNDFFNEARFVNDQELWGKSDYWATPVEFLIKDAGDCEDFSIAKYFTLTEMGMDVRKLRITYVKAINYNQAHMVLAYYSTPSADPLILDNLNKRLKPASERTDLKPVYSFNADELWLSRSRNEQVKAGSPSQLGNWQELNKRIFNIHKPVAPEQDPPSTTEADSTNDGGETSAATQGADSIRSAFEQTWFPGLSTAGMYLPPVHSLCDIQTLSYQLILASKNALPLLCRDSNFSVARLP